MKFTLDGEEGGRESEKIQKRLKLDCCRRMAETGERVSENALLEEGARRIGVIIAADISAPCTLSCEFTTELLRDFPPTGMD